MRPVSSQHMIDRPTRHVNAPIHICWDFAVDRPQYLVPCTSAVICADHASGKRYERKASPSHLCTKVPGAGMYSRLYRCGLGGPIVQNGVTL